MLVKVLAIPANKDYMIVVGSDGIPSKFPREASRFVRVGDVGEVVSFRNIIKLKLLTDDDECVMVASKAAYMEQATPPDPIQTPEST